MLLHKSDFVGFYALNFDDGLFDNFIQSVIEETEQTILQHALGSFAYREFVADLDAAGQPQSQKWIDFVDGVFWENQSFAQDLQKFEGFKKALLGFCYFNILKSKTLQNSAGVVMPISENQESTWQNSIIEANKRWNAAITAYNSAFDFLKYANENINKIADSVTDNTNNTYTYLVGNTDFLGKDGHIKVKGSFMKITNVTENTSVTFEAESGQALPLEFYYKKYFRVHHSLLDRKQIMQ